MNFWSKIIIFILTALFSIVSFGSSAFAAEDITSRLRIEPKSIKSSGCEWSIDISGQNVKEGDWATFRAENVSLIPGNSVDLKYKNDKIGIISVDKIYSDGHGLNVSSVVRKWWKCETRICCLASKKLFLIRILKNIPILKHLFLTIILIISHM